MGHQATDTLPHRKARPCKRVQRESRISLGPTTTLGLLFSQLRHGIPPRIECHLVAPRGPDAVRERVTLSPRSLLHAAALPSPSTVGARPSELGDDRSVARSSEAPRRQSLPPNHARKRLMPPARPATPSQITDGGRRTDTHSHVELPVYWERF